MDQLRLTIIGGSAASPNTGQGCSGYLIQSGECNVLIDPGPGTLQELRRHADFRTLDAVIVSHMHLDHCLDLLALRHALAYNPISPPEPVPVWLPPGGAAFLARAAAPFDECDEPGRFTSTIAVREYDPTRILTIGELTVTFHPTVHYLPTWAMRFEDAEGKTFGYSADTGPRADLACFFSDVDVLLAEATLLATEVNDSRDRGSLTASEAGALAKAAQARRLILTHIWEEHDPDFQLASAAGAFPGSITVAQVGLTVTL